MNAIFVLVKKNNLKKQIYIYMLIQWEYTLSLKELSKNMSL